MRSPAWFRHEVIPHGRVRSISHPPSGMAHPIARGLFSEMFQFRREIVISIVLAAMTLAVFGSACSFEFVNYDDPDYVEDNPHVRAGLTSDDVRWAFTAFYRATYQPLTWLSFQ